MKTGLTGLPVTKKLNSFPHRTGTSNIIFALHYICQVFFNSIFYFLLTFSAVVGDTCQCEFSGWISAEVALCPKHPGERTKAHKGRRKEGRLPKTQHTDNKHIYKETSPGSQDCPWRRERERKRGRKSKNNKNTCCPIRDQLVRP